MRIGAISILILAASTQPFTVCALASPLNNATQSSLSSEEILANSLEELKRIFKHEFSKDIKLKILSREQFEQSIGSAENLRAMYHDGQISLHLDTKKQSSSQQLRRTIRHEATHAAVAELSNSKCPAWLEEGLAQLFEGNPPKSLNKALREYLSHSEPLELSMLSDSLTLLEQSLVAVAYAHARFAAQTLVRSHGFSAIRNYLYARKLGQSHQQAFSQAFSTPVEEFEAKLRRQLRAWHQSGKEFF